MRRFNIIFILFFVLYSLFTIANSQWLETTILLPDSLGGLTGPGPAVYNHTNNLLYVAGARGVLAIDGATNCKIARIPADTGVGFLCINPIENKLYCASVDSILIVDCVSNCIIASLGVSSTVRCLCLNTVQNKLYVSTYSTGLVVIDGAGDSILRVCPLTGISTLCFNPTENKLYCPQRYTDTLLVIDGDSDTILHRVLLGRLLHAGPGDACLNPIENKLYLSFPSDIGPPAETTVTVIDCAGDSVLRRIRVAAGPGSMCYNAQVNKVYVSCSFWFNADICVIDGATDSVLVTLAGVYSPLCPDSINNVVYCRRGDSLAVIDGNLDSIVTVVPLQTYVTALCYNPYENVVYSISNYTDDVIIVDCNTYAVRARLVTGCWPGELLYVVGSNKLYCADYGSEYGAGQDLVVIDGITNTSIGTIAVGKRPIAMCSNLSGSRVYCANEASGTLSIIDGWADSLVATVPVGSLPCAVGYNSIEQKAYCASPGDYPEFDTVLTIVDGQSDTLIAYVTVGRHPCAICYSSGSNKVYVVCLVDHSVAVVDGASDSVIAKVVTGGTNPCDICYASGPNKVYVGHGVSGIVSVIDCDTDSIIVNVPVTQGAGDICYNPISNKVYCWAGLYGALFIIDAAADTVVASLGLTRSRGKLCCDTVFNKVYLVRYDNVKVIDGVTNELIATIPILPWGTDLAWNPVQGHVYISNSEYSCISVIADSLTGLTEYAHKVTECGTVPTILREVLHLPLVSNAEHSESFILFDITGRKVADLKAGANSIQHLAPGVYFISRNNNNQVTKIIVAK